MFPPLDSSFLAIQPAKARVRTDRRQATNPAVTTWSRQAPLPPFGAHTFSTDGSFRSLRSWLIKPRTSLKRYLPPLPRLRSSSTVPPVARAVSGSHVIPTRQTHDLRYGVSRFWHRYASRLTPLSAYDVPDWLTSQNLSSTHHAMWRVSKGLYPDA